jgi:GR25 family glycosyltransferase involved in LPS biosynthesis
MISRNSENFKELKILTNCQSYVINLERRPDRKEKFLKDYETLGPNIPLEVIRAVDGTTPNEVTTNTMFEYTSSDNDYQDNPRIRAKILSHLTTWSNIAKSDSYGLVFEDDVNFREDGKFKTLWEKIFKKLPPKFKKDVGIIYFGCGDTLPIHVDMPSAALLRSQEKSHVKPLINEYFGKENFGSPYICDDWLGGFSYILSPKSAQYLLDIAKEIPVRKAVDVWLKDIFDNNTESHRKSEILGNPGKSNYRYMTVPLLTYHNLYNLNFDSDTWGISIPKNMEIKETDSEKVKITFLIPTRSIDPEEPDPSDLEELTVNKYSNNPDQKNLERDPYKGMDTSKKERETRCEILERTLDSIIYKSSGLLDLNFIIRFDDDDNEVEEFITDYISELGYEHKVNFKLVKGPPLGRLGLHTMYNEMITSEVLESSDFISIWNDDTIITSDDWDRVLYNYYECIFKKDKNALACFQFHLEDSSFVNPILTSNFIKTIGYISKIPSVQEQLRVISYLSRINIYVRDVTIEKIAQYRRKYGIKVGKFLRDSILSDESTKENIDKAILEIRGSKDYLACGSWTREPKNWFNQKNIGTMLKDISNFSKDETSEYESFYYEEDEKPSSKLFPGKIITKMGEKIFYKSLNGIWKKVSEKEFPWNGDGKHTNDSLRLDDYNPNDSIRHGIAITRNTGRLGNKLFEYAYQRLVSKKYGLAFKSIYEKFPKPFDNIDTELAAFVSDPSIKLPKNYCERYPHSINLYKDHRSFFKEILTNDLSKEKVSDIVIHLRLDDVFDHELYTVLPFSFYKKVFDEILKNGQPMSSVILVAKPVNDFDKEILEKLQTFLLVNYSKVNKVIIQSNSISDDIITLMSAPIAVHSVSSFPFWPIFLSDIVKDVYIPTFEHPRFVTDATLEFNNWESTDDLTVNKIRLSLDKKIERKELDRLFDC